MLIITYYNQLKKNILISKWRTIGISIKSTTQKTPLKIKLNCYGITNAPYR